MVSAAAVDAETAGGKAGPEETPKLRQVCDEALPVPGISGSAKWRVLNPAGATRRRPALALNHPGPRHPGRGAPAY